MELFETAGGDARGSAQGRHSKIRPGQVGLRCRHCANVPKPARARGSIYYSKTIDGVYQIAQNMSKLHFSKCQRIPKPVKYKLIHLRTNHERASGGKEYWSESLRVLGVIETDGMLKFSDSVQCNSSKAKPMHNIQAVTNASIVANNAMNK